MSVAGVYLLDDLGEGDCVVVSGTDGFFLFAEKALPLGSLLAQEVAFGVLRASQVRGERGDVAITGQKVPAIITGLASDATGPVRISSVGRCELVGAPSAGDFLIGSALLGELTVDPRAAYVPVTGAPIPTVTSVKTGAYAASIDELVLVDTSAGPVPIAFPSASGNTGRQVRVRKVSLDLNSAIASGSGGQLIDGVPLRAFDQPLQETAYTSVGDSWVSNPALPHSMLELSPRAYFRADDVCVQGTTITRANDRSGFKRHADPPSSGERPTQVIVNGLPLMRFSGAQMLRYIGAISVADIPMTIIVVSRMNVASQTGFLVEVSDQVSGFTANRSLALFQGEGGGYRVARHFGAGNGAFDLLSSTELVVERAEFTATERRLYRNGELIAGDSHTWNVATPKAFNTFAIAGALGQSAYFQGDIWEVAIL